MHIVAEKPSGTFISNLKLGFQKLKAGVNKGASGNVTARGSPEVSIQQLPAELASQHQSRADFEKTADQVLRLSNEQIATDPLNVIRAHRSIILKVLPHADGSESPFGTPGNLGRAQKAFLNLDKVEPIALHESRDIKERELSKTLLDRTQKLRPMVPGIASGPSGPKPRP